MTAGTLGCGSNRLHDRTRHVSRRPYRYGREGELLWEGAHLVRENTATVIAQCCRIVSGISAKSSVLPLQRLILRFAQQRSPLQHRVHHCANTVPSSDRGRIARANLTDADKYPNLTVFFMLLTSCHLLCHSSTGCLEIAG
jgi:hypothetical protein